MPSLTTCLIDTTRIMMYVACVPQRPWGPHSCARTFFPRLSEATLHLTGIGSEVPAGGVTLVLHVQGATHAKSSVQSVRGKGLPGEQ